MAEHDAIFGGEHSAHYYFRDFWGADTGMLAALRVPSEQSAMPDRPLSRIRTVSDSDGLCPIRRASDPRVADQQMIMDRVAARRSLITASKIWNSEKNGLSLARTVGQHTTEQHRAAAQAQCRSRHLETMETLRDETLGLIRA